MALLRQCLAELRFARGDIDDNTAFLEPADDAFLGALMLERGCARDGASVSERHYAQMQAGIGVRVSGLHRRAIAQPMG